MISINEIKRVFTGAGSSPPATPTPEDEQIWLQIMEEVDKNNDNVISPKEFNEAMTAVMEARALSQVGSQVSLGTQ